MPSNRNTSWAPAGLVVAAATVVVVVEAAATAVVEKAAAAVVGKAAAAAALEVATDVAVDGEPEAGASVNACPTFGVSTELKIWKD